MLSVFREHERQMNETLELFRAGHSVYKTLDVKKHHSRYLSHNANYAADGSGERIGYAHRPCR